MPSVKTARKSTSARATRATATKTSTKHATQPAAKAESCCSSAAASTFQPTAGTIVHIDFTAPNIQQASKFYAGLFGWQLQGFQPKELYVQTPGNAGPCLCLLEGAPTTTAQSTFYVNVDNITATLAKAKALGGSTVTPKTEIPGGHGFIAKIRTPDGNTIGVYSRS